MTLEHFSLLMRFRNGDNLTIQEVNQLAAVEGQWVIDLWNEEQSLAQWGDLPV